MKTKRLLTIKKKQSGRDSAGHVSIRHRGGEQKRFLRQMDWRRVQKDIPARVESIEYDPNRTTKIALLLYPNGSRSYILAPDKLSVGDILIASENAPIKPGNNLPLFKIPAGIPLHCLEQFPGGGAKLIRSAGSSAYVQSVEKDKAIIKLPSGELKIFPAGAWATIGQLSNPSHNQIQIGSAGRLRRMGIRPTVRGVVQHPNSHPHGGGEGKSGIGMKYPKTPWGKPALGKKTRSRKKYSNHLIIKRRK